MHKFYTKKVNNPTLDALLDMIETREDFDKFVLILNELVDRGIVSEADDYEYYNEAYYRLYGTHSDAYLDANGIENYIGSACDINCDNDIGDNPTETYYNIMNILDAHAVQFEQLSPETIAELDRLAEGLGSEPTKYYIESIADANDCGICDTWQEVVDALAELFEEGERGPVDVPMENWKGKRWYKHE